MDIAANIKYLKGVGEKRAAMLGKLGVHTLGDLLTLYPRAYEDWSSVIPIAGRRSARMSASAPLSAHAAASSGIRKA